MARRTDGNSLDETAVDSLVELAPYVGGRPAGVAGEASTLGRRASADSADGGKSPGERLRDSHLGG